MSFNDKLDKLLEKIPAGYFAILTAILGAFSVIFASIVYYLGDSSFSLTSHWISHLGAGPGPRPNASSLAFTIGLITTGCLALPFLFDLHRKLKPDLEKHKTMLFVAFLSSIISITGLFINAIWNMEDDPELHVTGSSIFFFGGLIMVLFYSLSMLFSDEMPKVQAYIGFGIASTFFAFLISYLPFIFQGVDLMVLLTSTDPRAGLTRFIEWIVFAAVIFWFLEMGIFTLKAEK